MEVRSTRLTTLALCFYIVLASYLGSRKTNSEVRVPYWLGSRLSGTKGGRVGVVVAGKLAI
ncbi:hypothetical protein CCACVL1_15721 [Corchorus capsularis]|uniref:Uncharacterized protein n=1 Tax=Corchorus capsularis TaxID=210143 RepID=A0A1R3I1E6_COCAP|nr:hypothetical protein CCACVL1_15721 [Corchorus capsularis]